MTWYLAGFAGIGLLTGLFVGMSESPVIATVLPLLFSLLAGTGGLYLAKGDFQSDIGRLRFRFLGMAVTAFAVTCLAASLYGVSVRTGAGPGAFFGLADARESAIAPLPDDKGLGPSQAVGLAIIRAELAAIGVSARDQRTLLQKFMIVPEDDSYVAARTSQDQLLQLVKVLRNQPESASAGEGPGENRPTFKK